MKAAVGTLCLLLVPRWQRAALSEREGAESPLPPSPACGKPSRPDLQERLQPSARSYEVSVSQEGGWHFHCARWGCVAMCSRFHSLSSSTQRRSLSLFQSDPSHPSPPSREIRLRCPRQPSVRGEWPRCPRVLVGWYLHACLGISCATDAFGLQKCPRQCPPVGLGTCGDSGTTACATRALQGAPEAAAACCRATA